MKPVYLLLLVLIAIGFFACERDLLEPSQPVAQSEDKVLGTNELAEFSARLADINLFDESTHTDPSHYGAGEVRLFIDEAGDLALDFLTENLMISSADVADPADLLPTRAWHSTIELLFEPNEENRLRHWLIQNFKGSQSLALRIALRENGTIFFAGLAERAA
ncbi:hypothetical protein [Lewinella sp. W8]|uniref:hypothetical protein n=1 Tax=Lewinella sp. W8 TaxID=2528208 RepID=UPI00106836F6|nr:hypothetical protein [Lewinella sp. W8]MTB52391.1 hypothetical protein [Lewinella sp. W8]